MSQYQVSPTEIVTGVLGIAYVVLAALRIRWCWLAGAAASAMLAVLSFQSGLPMQGALNVYYIGMAAYGFWNWQRAAGIGELPVRRWPIWCHVLAFAVIAPFSYATAQLLASETQAAWPLLDSLTTWFSLLATWLAARAILENWLYWVIIDGVLVYLYYVQGKPIIAAQFAVFTVMAIAGFIAWKRRLRAQTVAT